MKKVDCLHNPSTTNPKKKKTSVATPNRHSLCFWRFLAQNERWQHVIVLVYDCHQSSFWCMVVIAHCSEIWMAKTDGHFIPQSCCSLRSQETWCEHGISSHHSPYSWPLTIPTVQKHPSWRGEPSASRWSSCYSPAIPVLPTSCRTRSWNAIWSICQEANKLLNAVISTSATVDAVHERGSIQISKNVICNFLKKPIKGTCRVCLHLVIERSQGGVMWFFARHHLVETMFLHPFLGDLEIPKGTKTSIYISSLESWVVDPRYTTHFVPI